MLHKIESLKNMSLLGTALCVMLIGCMVEVNFTGIFIIGTVLVICLCVYCICQRVRKTYLQAKTPDKMMIKAPGRRNIA